MSSKFQIEKIIPSDRLAINQVEPLILVLKEKVEFDEKMYHNLLISITEAVNNAIIHGNKLDINKKVNITLTYDDKFITCIIKDEGNGFDVNKIPDPRNPENLLKDNGRGVFIINSLAYNVEYNSDENGTTLKMIFEI